jgi:hypothetical protein
LIFLGSNPGCYDSFNDGTEDSPIYIPASAEEVGFKFTGSFEVPVNGTVDIVTDFDVRKSLRLLNSGSYYLQPTVRMLITSETGNIAGSILNPDSEKEYIVFAYLADSYDSSEADLPIEEGEVQFANAETSDLVEDLDSDGTQEFSLAYLVLDSYDLVITQKKLEEGVLEYVGIIEDVLLDVNGTKTVNIDCEALSL